MNEREIYNERLLIFADHLAGVEYHKSHDLIEEVELVGLADKIRIHYQVKYKHWVLDELPNAFEEWTYHEQTGAASYPGCDPELGAAAAYIDYMRLSEDEFCHLLDIEGFQQPERFGGKKLDENSSGKDFADNIAALVKHRRKVVNEGH